LTAEKGSKSLLTPFLRPASDFALLSLIFNTGGRVSKMVALLACDLRLTSPPSVLLRGKGRKERICPIRPHTAKRMHGLINLVPS
jgi:site-specific recombinase XerD